MRLLIAIVATSVCCQSVAADYLGHVLAVSDGDTFTMETDGGKVRVRICGIDAPERGQAGYGQAAGVLSNMIEGKMVHCLQIGEGTPCDGRSRPNSRDRIVAQCFLDKADIAEQMTRSGTACDWPKFSGGRYKVSDTTCSRK
jgi:endonuclease YncB( thermonuclease family)